MNELVPKVSSLLRMNIPDEPYVALYGSHAGGWREKCTALLCLNNIPWYDSTDEHWDSVSDRNGDQRQLLINHLVAKEQQGLLRANCVVFHLAYQLSDVDTNNVHLRENVRDTQKFLAARCELGFLIGRGIRTYVHIASDIEGRNYLWAAMRISPHMIRCSSLTAAVNKAITYMQGIKTSIGSKQD